MITSPQEETNYIKTNKSIFKTFVPLNFPNQEAMSQKTQDEERRQSDVLTARS